MKHCILIISLFLLGCATVTEIKYKYSPDRMTKYQIQDCGYKNGSSWGRHDAIWGFGYDPLGEYYNHFNTFKKYHGCDMDDFMYNETYRESFLQGYKESYQMNRR